jgi:hypothetical protein
MSLYLMELQTVVPNCQDTTAESILTYFIKYQRYNGAEMVLGDAYDHEMSLATRK